jgi:hypothetical protein
MNAERASVASLTAYPNPVVERVYIQFPEAAKQPDASAVTVFDQVGRSYPLNAAWHSENTTLEVDFSIMTKGLYFIRVVTEFGAQTLKVQKE